MPIGCSPTRRRTDPFHPGCGTRRAFTLIELIAVISILAIVAVTAIPSLNDLSRQRRQAAAQQLLRDIAYARELALTRALGTWVVFSVAQQTYSVLADTRATPGRGNAATITDPGTGSLYIQRLNSGELTGIQLVFVSIPGGGNGTDLGFDRLGRPVNSTGTLITTAATITLSNNNVVTVQPRSGLVSRAVTAGGG